MSASLWSHIVTELEGLLSEQDLNMYVRPLHVIELSDELRLLAPNRYAVEGIEHTCLDIIRTRASTAGKSVLLSVGSANVNVPAPEPNGHDHAQHSPLPPIGSRLNREFSFDTFVQGKSNQLARAASIQVSQNPGGAYNPLFICGGVGLGKTHLMHGVGNIIEKERSGARVAYVRSERFVHDMVTALQHNRINEFKELYRSLDALLIDDIQFLAGKERSQEEFFHTFNALLEAGAQVVLTCDRYPKEVDGLEERLKSRFGQGLTVAIDPPELETSVAILKSKAEAAGIELPDEVAFLVSRSMRSNVRELEGALRRIIATAELTGQEITLEFAKHALRDLLVVSEKLISLETIQRTVAEYFNILVSELLSKRRSRSIARPRQIAMALAKELTNHSYPEIGDAFGGRDHTTVLHACRKIAELRETDQRVHEDYKNLLRILTQ